MWGDLIKDTARKKTEKGPYNIGLELKKSNRKMELVIIIIMMKCVLRLKQ